MPSDRPFSTFFEASHQTVHFMTPESQRMMHLVLPISRSDSSTAGGRCSPAATLGVSPQGPSVPNINRLYTEQRNFPLHGSPSYSQG